MSEISIRGYGCEFVTLFDDDDHDLVLTRRKGDGVWHPKKHRNTWYAFRHHFVDGKRTTQTMHKLITGFAQTDHVNHNGLDNRRSNLREVTTSQNAWNQQGVNKGSQYKGVTWSKSHRKWQASIRVNRKGIWLGRHATEAEAALAYDRAALEYFGTYACVNFLTAADAA